MPSKNILIVEDELIIADEIAEHIKALGYTVAGKAGRAEKALEILVQKPVDLILMDIRIRGNVDGIDLTCKINEKYSIPVIFLTAYLDEATINRAKETISYGYLLKPFTRETLKVSIEMALARENSEREVRHLVKILTIIKDINLILRQETDPQNLINRVEKKIKTLSYFDNVWLLVHDYDNTPMYSESIPFNIKVNKIEGKPFANKNIPRCFHDVSQRKETVLGFQGYCDECEWKLCEDNSTPITLPLLHIKNFYGFLHVSISSQVGYFFSEIDLLQELAENIAFSLYSIEQKRARDQGLLREKQKQKELEHANRLVSLGYLSAGIAHEINNPNNYIRLNTPLLFDVYKEMLPILDEYFKEHPDLLLHRMPYEEVKEQIPYLFSGILEGSKKIEVIVKELKDFSRKDELEFFQWTDINKVVKSATVLLANAIKKACHNFTVNYGEMKSIFAHPQRIEQVIINIIQNACEALSSRDDSVTVSTHYNDEQKEAVIVVEDSGCGMSQEQSKMISEAFYTTKRDSGGTGLGLSIASQIIRQHQGRLEYKSNPGKGTQAIITLPLLKERPKK